MTTTELRHILGRQDVPTSAIVYFIDNEGHKREIKTVTTTTVVEGDKVVSETVFED